MANDLTLVPGSTFADYRIEGQLGVGASGLVFAATRLSNDKPVALKVLRSELSGETLDDERERFLREVKTCIGLSHPNIAPIIDSGLTDDGVPFAAYERVPGETLKDLLERDGGLPFRDTVWLMGQVLRALVYSHAKGVVHRDIKPSNIMVSHSEGMYEARVLDFGVAGRLRTAASTPQDTFTKHGYFVGTPLYSCLDQVRGDTPRPAWDLFAWSLVLLECLLGQHPCTASGRMPWDPESNIEIQSWLRRHSLGQFLERILVPEETPDVDANQLLHTLEAAGRELNPRLPTAPPAQRRWVCVGACQFSETLSVGTTENIEGHDEAVRACQEMSADVVEQLGGRVLSRVGDRLMFGFGYAQPHEDDAVRAVEASRQIIDAASGLEYSRASVTLQAHVGLHAGEAIFEGQTTDGFADVAGATPEGATRLGQLANPGDVVASDALRELLRPSTDLELLDETHLPGIPQPVTAYRISPDVRFGVHESAPRTPFVGRQREMELLESQAREAQDGRPGVVSITGEAGIGKSRLLRELQNRISGTWLECRCQPDSQSSPYYPIAQLLDSIGAPTTELLQTNGLASEINIALLEAMRTGDPQALRLMGVSTGRQREMLRELLIRLLTGLAEREFVVIAIEDLHWADPSTVELITQLIGDAAAWTASDYSLQLLAITSARPEFIPPWSHGPTLIQLDRLQNADAEALILGLNDELAADHVAAIVKRAEGVPLFVEEITLAGAHLARGAESTFSSAGIPPVLFQYLAPRLEALSAGAQEILRIASVLGREFDEELLEAIANRSPEEFARNLRELTSGSVLYRRRTATSTVCAFKHVLIRDVAYDAIPRTARPNYHSQVAQALTNQLPELAARRPETVASNYMAGGHVAEAIDWWNTAMPRLLAAGAYDEAKALGQRALKATATLADPDARAQAELAVRELLGTAVASKVGLGAEEVHDIYAPAIELCERIGDDAPLGVLWGIWSFTVVAGAEVEPTQQLVNRFLETASKTDDPVIVATAHAATGTRQFLMGDVRGSLEHFDVADQAAQADEFKRSVRYHDVGMFIPAWRMSSLALSGDFDAAARVRSGLLDEARNLGSPSGLSVALSFALNSYRIGLDYDGTVALADEQLSLCQEQRIIGLVGAAQCSRGWARVCRGEADGLDEIRQGIALCDALGMRLNQVMHMASLAEAEFLLGHPDNALATVRHAQEQSANTIERYQDAELLRTEGDIRRSLGDLDEAECAFRAAVTRARELGIYVHEIKATLGLVDLLAQSKGQDAARQAARDLGALPELEAEVPLITNARTRLSALGT